MTVQTKINDGISTRTRTYRNIYKGKNLAEFREGFFAQEEHCRWGIMVQLKGHQRILLHRFGETEEEHDTKPA